MFRAEGNNNGTRLITTETDMTQLITAKPVMAVSWLPSISNWDMAARLINDLDMEDTDVSDCLFLFVHWDSNLN